jgi:hypothetical protein
VGEENRHAPTLACNTIGVQGRQAEEHSFTTVRARRSFLARALAGIDEVADEHGELFTGVRVAG